jgi:Cys-tRNA(Pro)/Cys-tRNA(Cys) deacylase
MNKPVMTNAMRILSSNGIGYRVQEYAIDDSDLSAELAAQLLGMPPERVFKTLVASGDRTGAMIVLLPAGTVVDLKRLAVASGDKRIELKPLSQVLKLTGYERGAVSPLGMRRRYPVYIDETIELWSEVGISAGAKGLEILIAPADLIEITSAKLVDLAVSA